MKEEKSILAINSEPRNMCVTPNGRIFLFVEDKISVWDAKTKSHIKDSKRLNTHEIHVSCSFNSIYVKEYLFLHHRSYILDGETLCITYEFPFTLSMPLIIDKNLFGQDLDGNYVCLDLKDKEWVANLRSKEWLSNLAEQKLKKIRYPKILTHGVLPNHGLVVFSKSLDDEIGLDIFDKCVDTWVFKLSFFLGKNLDLAGIDYYSLVIPLSNERLIVINEDYGSSDSLKFKTTKILDLDISKKTFKTWDTLDVLRFSFDSPQVCKIYETMLVARAGSKCYILDIDTGVIYTILDLDYEKCLFFGEKFKKVAAFQDGELVGIVKNTSAYDDTAFTLGSLRIKTVDLKNLPLNLNTKTISVGVTWLPPSIGSIILEYYSDLICVLIGNVQYFKADEVCKNKNSTKMSDSPFILKPLPQDQLRTKQGGDQLNQNSRCLVM